MVFDLFRPLSHWLDGIPWCCSKLLRFRALRLSLQLVLGPHGPHRLGLWRLDGRAPAGQRALLWPCGTRESADDLGSGHALLYLGIKHALGFQQSWCESGVSRPFWGEEPSGMGRVCRAPTHLVEPTGNRSGEGPRERTMPGRLQFPHTSKQERV